MADPGTLSALKRAVLAVQSGKTALTTLNQISTEVARLHPQLRQQFASFRAFQEAIRAATGLSEAAGDTAVAEGMMPPGISEQRRRQVVEAQLGRGPAAPPAEPNSALSLTQTRLHPDPQIDALLREAEDFLADLERPGQRQRQAAQQTHDTAVALSLGEVRAPFKGEAAMRILNSGELSLERQAQVLKELNSGAAGAYLAQNVAVGPPVPQPSTRGPAPAAPTSVRTAPAGQPCPIRRPQPTDVIDTAGNTVLERALGRGDDDHDRADDLDADERQEQASLLRLLALDAQKPGIDGLQARELLRRAATPSAYGPGGARELLTQLRQALAGTRPASVQGYSTSEATAHAQHFVV
jgi:hypothetical protein